MKRLAYVAANLRTVAGSDFHIRIWPPFFFFCSPCLIFKYLGRAGVTKKEENIHTLSGGARMEQSFAAAVENVLSVISTAFETSNCLVLPLCMLMGCELWNESRVMERCSSGKVLISP